MPDTPETAEWRPHRAEGLELQPLGEETLVLDRKNERLHRLNTVSAEVLQRCDGRRTPAEIAEEVHRDYLAPLSQVGEEIGALLLRMKALEMVR